MNNHLPTISICPIGGEQYVEFEDRTKRGHPIRVQYDYRHTDGILYSTIADDLEAARARRDAWLERRRTSRAPNVGQPSRLKVKIQLPHAGNANR